MRAFVSLVRASADVVGSRMWDVLTNAASVIAGQGLSLLELLRFLQSPEYRAGLLAQATQTPAWRQFEEAHRYFEWEFAALSAGEQGSYTAPVLNKIRALIDIPYLKALLCADADTLDLAGLWQTPRLVAVHLDTWALGEDGVRLLSGLLAHSLFQTAMRQSGPVPVCLCLDEMGMQERFLGEAIRDILAMARSQNLRLLCACQHLEQLSGELRAALLANTALRVFFRLSPDDARHVAASFATGLGSQPTRIALSLAAGGKSAPEGKSVPSGAETGDMESVSHAVVDQDNRPLCVSPLAWNEFSRVQAASEHSDREEPRRLAALITLMRLSFIARLYVRVPGSPEAHEIAAYLAGLPAHVYHFTGPAPLRLVIRFPRLKVTLLDSKGEAERARDLARALMDLPVQEALVRTDTGTTARLRIVSVPFPVVLPEAEAFLDGGQEEEEIAATSLRRSQEIDRLSVRGEAIPSAPPSRSPSGPAKRAAASLSKGRQSPQARLQTPRADLPAERRFPDAGPENAAQEKAAPENAAQRNAPQGGTPTQQELLGSQPQNAATEAAPLLWGRPLPPEPEVADDGSL